MEDWRKVIFSDKSRVSFGAGGDQRKFVCHRSSEKFNEDCLNYIQKYPQFCMIWTCISQKEWKSLVRLHFPR